MRKWAKFILVAALILLLTIPAAAKTGNDKVDWLIDQEIVIGDGSGSYKLQDNISRSEATKMLVESLQRKAEADRLKDREPTFDDVKVSDWFNGYLNYAMDQQIINGYGDNTFRPQKDVTVEEMLKMLVVAHGGMTGDEKITGYWATPYITKAREMGFLTDITIDDYKAPAKREVVFEMIYNSLNEGVTYNNPLNKNEYYAVVTGASNLAGLETRLDTIIIEAGKGSNYHLGNSFSFNTDAEGIDIDILGKAVKFTVDERDIVTNVTEAGEVTIFDGPAELKDKTVYISGFNFNIPSSYRTGSMLMHNDELELYGDFLNRYGGNSPRSGNSYVSEYARVFVRNNFVLFVESYEFSDIAPVQSLSPFGAFDVYYYDDYHNGDTEVADIKVVTGFHGNQKVNMKLEDIKANDIIHVYNRDSALVYRNDPKTGVFEGPYPKDGAYYIKIGNGEYQTRTARSKQPVLMDGRGNVSTFEGDRTRDYRDMKGETVSVLLDLDGHVQLISSDGALGSSDVGIFKFEGARYLDIVGYGTNLEPGPRMEYRIGSERADSRDIQEGDLVYIEKSGNQVQLLNRLYTSNEMDRNAAPVRRNADNSLAIDRGIIELVGGGWNNEYSYDNDTNVFAIQGDTKDGLVKIEEVTMDFVVKNGGQNLRAFVMTEDQFQRAAHTKFGDDGRQTDRKAHTIVFFSFGPFNSPLASNAYRLDRDYAGGQDQGMWLRDPRGHLDFYEFYRQSDFRNMDSIPEGTDIQIELRSGDIYKIVDIMSTRGEEGTFRVYHITLPSGNQTGVLILEDSRADTKTFTLDYSNMSDLVRNLKKHDIVTADFDGDTLNKIINRYSDNMSITGEFK